MTKRGRILRDTNTGVGLISAEGKQYEFRLEKTWDSDAAPIVGMVVEVELDDNGQLVAAWAVDETELAKEQASLILNETKKRILGGYNQAAKVVGKPVLIATVALILGWFVFNLFSVNIPISFMPGQKFEVTFWQSIGLVNNLTNLQALMTTGFLNANKGFYGFLCIAALTGPFLFIVWKHPLAHLGNLAPLLFMILIAGIAYLGYTDQVNASQEAMAKIGGGFGGEMLKSMTNGMFDNIMKMITIGIGSYLTLAASLYLAFVGVSKYLVASASNNVPSSIGGSIANRPSSRRSLQQSLGSENLVPMHVEKPAMPAATKAHINKCPTCNISCNRSQ